MKKYAIYLCGGVGFAALLILWRNHPAPVVAVPQEEKLTAHAGPVIPWRSNVIAKPQLVQVVPKGRDASDAYVNLERMNHDPAYAKIIGKHRAIKAYLASPLKGKSDFEPVVDWVIGNGYEIQDLSMIWSEAQGLNGAIKNRNQIEAEIRAMPSAQNKSEDWVQSNVSNLFGSQSSRMKEIMRMGIGLRPDETQELESLWVYTRRIPNNLELASLYTEPDEGEKILTDDDWMSPERKKMVADYTGPHRTTDTRQWDFASLLPEQERPSGTKVVTPTVIPASPKQ